MNKLNGIPNVSEKRQLSLFLILTSINIGLKGIFYIVIEFFLHNAQNGRNLISVISMISAFTSCAILIIIAAKRKKPGITVILIALLQILVIDPQIISANGNYGYGKTLWYMSTILYVVILVEGKIRYILYAIAAVSAAAIHYLGLNSAYYRENAYSRCTEYVIAYIVLLTVSASVIIMTEREIKLLRQTALENEAQKKEIENLNKAQNRFFSNMSHEIRTPINTIIGLNEMILREDTSAEVAEDARNIQSASKMLLSLINDILDMSKIESGKMDIIRTTYDVGEMLSEIVNMIWGKANEKGLKFYVNVDPNMPSKLFCDDVRIKQILINLLNNAVKYTHEGSVYFSIHCEFKSETKALITYTVEDTGTGIRKESLPHLFDAFRREDEDQNKYIEGTGLGLSIVKQLVDLLGGEVTVNSVYTKGSTFVVAIEQDIVEHEAIGEFNPDKSYSGKESYSYNKTFEAPEAKVLIVDDNTANLMVTSKLLRDTLVNITTAESGQEALKLTSTEHFDVIFMDHLMPEMDGIECLHAIRDQRGGLCHDVPIVALTANAGLENQALYRSEGFDGYIIKPVSGKELEETLLSLLPDDIVRITEEDVKKDANSIIRDTSRKVPLLITTDSVSDLPLELVKKYKIPVLPYNVHMMGGIFTDGYEMEGDVLIRYIEDKAISARSEAPDIIEYEKFFASSLTKALNILHIAMAKNSSKGYKNACEAALSFNNVTVIDSGHLSSGMGIATIYAKLLSDKGYDHSYIIKALSEKKNKIQTSFIVDSTEYLYKSGRLSERIHKLCNAFMLHPVINMKKSAMTVSKIIVGSRKRVRNAYIRKALRYPATIDRSILFITYTGLSAKEVEDIKKEVLSRVSFEKVYLQKASPAISINCGPGTFGLIYSRK